MIINRENYEPILLDFLEGRLSEEDQEMVREFLILNPDLADDIDDLRSMVLESETISMHEKDHLRKSIPDRNSRPGKSNFDLFSIAYLEKDLSDEQKKAFDKLRNTDPELEKEFQLWSRIKLDPPIIIYPRKNRLKKSQAVTMFSARLLIPTAVAASLAILLSIFIRPGNNEPLLTNIETDNDQQAGTEIVQTEPGEELIIAEGPASFAIKQNENPPELTGIDNDQTSGPTDTSGEIIGEPENTMKSIEEDLEMHTEENNLVVASNFKTAAVYNVHTSPDQIKTLKLPITPVHLSNLGIREIAKLDLDDILNEVVEEEVTLWRVAKASVDGVNRLVGSDMSLLAIQDEEGDQSGFYFNSRRLKIAAPFENRENQ